MTALPPSVSQLPGKYLCFLVKRINEKNTIDPEHVMLALTRLRDFMVERRIMEVSMPVYDPNRGKLSPRELYAILHVILDNGTPTSRNRAKTEAGDREAEVE